MEEISLKGEKYIKASVIAEKLGYTADYVGQLCRSNQVDATLVGRSWYVNEKSISQHKKSRYRSTLSKSKESVRKIAEERTVFRKHSYSSKNASYKQDDSDLMPVIIKKNEPEKTVKEDISIRDIEPIKAENKPFNQKSFRSAEKYSNKIIKGTSRALPPVRVISAKPVDMKVVQPELQEIRQKPKAYSRLTYKPHKEEKSGNNVTRILFGLTAVVVSLGVFFSVVGLEKRVVLVDSGEEVILYNFSLTEIHDYIFKYLNI